MTWLCNIVWQPSLFMIPFTLYKCPPLLTPMHPWHISSTILDRWHQALQHLFICSAPYNFVRLCNPSTQTFDSSVHDTFSPSHSLSSICVLLPIWTFSIYSPVTGLLRFLKKKKFCLGGRGSLLKRRLVFCGYYLIKLLSETRPVRHVILRLESLVYLSSFTFVLQNRRGIAMELL